MSERQDVTFTVNGDKHAIRVEPRRSLADALREDCGLTGPISAASTASAAPAPCWSTTNRCAPA